MITIKDFAPGGKAYSVLMNKGRNAEPVITETEIKSVGRVYVTTGNGSWERKYMNCNSDYLEEKVSWGESSLLFRTQEEAQNYIEKCELVLWLGCLSVTKAESYSLEQLRKVKEILS